MAPGRSQARSDPSTLPKIPPAPPCQGICPPRSAEYHGGSMGVSRGTETLSGPFSAILGRLCLFCLFNCHSPAQPPPNRPDPERFRKVRSCAGRFGLVSWFTARRAAARLLDLLPGVVSAARTAALGDRPTRPVITNSAARASTYGILASNRLYTERSWCIRLARRRPAL